MGRKKPTTRVVGVYPHPKSGFRVIYLIDGKEKAEYFPKGKGSKERAEARAQELEKKFKRMAMSDINPDQKPTAEIVSAPEGKEHLSRDYWLRIIWDQFKALATIGDERLQVEALDAMRQAYKAVRDDLRIAEQDLDAADEPANLSDDELQAKVIQLKRVLGE